MTVFVAATLLGLVADLASKHLVFRSLLSDPSVATQLDHLRTDPAVTELPPEAILKHLRLQHQVCPGVQLTLSTNPGVVFGWRQMPRWTVVVATFVAIGLVSWFFATAAAKVWATHVALASILGGALGNLYDRLFSAVTLPGLEPIRYQVRDFIDCSGLHYPWVFNIADALLVVGVAILALQWFIAAWRGRGASAKKGT